jgi:UDP-N-acetylmuramoyl-tripeptide--D-alanyl-D-alanine ligase
LFRASDVAAATGGHLAGHDVSLSGASFDTRTLKPGELFVPLIADRDGHDFIAAAAAAGAGAYLTSAEPDERAGSLTSIRVGDTAVALMELAAWASRRLPATVVGITGSVGKTSTKDLAAAAIASSKRVAANERSFNNEQGLPVTVLGAPDDTEVLVLEMGMRGFGEIARLCAVAPPTVGVVTAVAPAHTERLGGIDGVARAKAELVIALPRDGVAVLNGDDDRVRAMSRLTEASVVLCGESPGVDVRADTVVLDDLARPRFTARTPWGAADVTLAVSGRHMVGNALAAIATAGCLGVDVDAAAAALAGARLSASRMSVRRLPSGAVVIDDAYNANPASMRAALDALAAIPAERRVAVLGVMAEIDDPAGAHRAIRAYATERGLDVVAVGTDHYGVAPVDDPLSVIGTLGPGTVVLVKASRVAQLDRVAAALVASCRTDAG